MPVPAEMHLNILFDLAASNYFAYPVYPFHENLAEFPAALLYEYPANFVILRIIKNKIHILECIHIILEGTGHDRLRSVRNYANGNDR